MESGGSIYKLQTLADFRNFKEFALSKDAWTTHYSDLKVRVESRPPKDNSTSLNIVRVQRNMKGVPCEDLYDNLHDAKYRENWDENMIEGYNIVKLDAHNDIGYYAVRFPWPLKNRDFCNMRSWMEFSNGEYIIFNHSVQHPDCPEKKGFVRAKSILTGYLVQPMQDGEGCILTYITHGDPCGLIPHAIINMTVTRLVPKVMNQLEECTKKYPIFVVKSHTVGRENLPWRTPKVDWDSKLNSPNEEPAAEVPKAIHPKGQSDANEINGDHNQVMASPDVSFQCPPGVVSGNTIVSQFSLAPVAPNCSDDIVVIQRYRALMQDSMNAVDRTFLQDSRTPTLKDYLTRFAFIVDGVRQTTPH